MINLSNITIIVVNYKSTEHTKNLLNFLKITNNNVLPCPIIIVDNSCDGLLKKENFINDKKITLIETNKNIGFGRANNLAINQVTTDYILLLNPDVIVSTNEIQKCLNHISSDPHIGALGCKLINQNNEVQNSFFTVGSFLTILANNLIIDKFFPLKKIKKNAIMGAFMLIPKAVLDKVGLFDPDFFMYAEELELCYRIYKAGYKIVYFDEAQAIHINEGCTNDISWSRKQRGVSDALCYYKTRGIFGYFIYHLLWIFNYISNFLTMWFIDKNYRKQFYKDVYYYFSNIKYYICIPFLFSTKMGNGKRMLKRK